MLALKETSSFAPSSRAFSTTELGSAKLDAEGMNVITAAADDFRRVGATYTSILRTWPFETTPSSMSSGTAQINDIAAAG
jgi:hypothetical protein